MCTVWVVKGTKKDIERETMAGERESMNGSQLHRMAPTEKKEQGRRNSKKKDDQGETE